MNDHEVFLINNRTSDFLDVDLNQHKHDNEFGKKKHENGVG